MTKFRIPFSVTSTVYVDVEADDQDEAIEIALGKVHLRPVAVVGESIKSIGVSLSGDCSIEPGDDFEVVKYLIQEL